MRRTYAEPFEDVRADGSTVVIPPGSLQFYWLEGASLRVGNKDALEPSDPPLDSATASTALRIFANLQAALDGRTTTELLDPETRQALDALGYAR
jgi:hypothetical protein